MVKEMGKNSIGVHGLEQIVAEKTNYRRKVVNEIVKCLEDTILEEVVKGKRVSFSVFMGYSIKVKEADMYIPGNGLRYKMPEHYCPKVKIREWFKRDLRAGKHSMSSPEENNNSNDNENED